MKIMRFKNVILILFCFWLTAFFGQNVIACSCGGRLSTAEAFEKAKIVFVGEVVKVIESPLKTSSKKNPDGSTTVSVEMDSPTIFKISVKKAFRGIETETVEFVQSRGDSCAYPFSKGESYLIFATLEGGKLQTDKCSNTNLLSKSIEAVKFIEGWGNKNLQTLISGKVLRRIFDKDSKLALQVPFEELKIIAKSKDKIYEVFSEKFGLYEIVLPPNDYQIWVERDEKRISKIEQVSAVAGKNIELLLQVEF